MCECCIDAEGSRLFVHLPIGFVALTAAFARNTSTAFEVKAGDVGAITHISFRAEFTSSPADDTTTIRQWFVDKVEVVNQQSGAAGVFHYKSHLGE